MEDQSPTLSVTGVQKLHARKAITWLRKRSILAFYRAKDKSLNAFVTKHGEAMTYDAMHKALDETKR